MNAGKTCFLLYLLFYLLSCSRSLVSNSMPTRLVYFQMKRGLLRRIAFLATASYVLAAIRMSTDTRHGERSITLIPM
ncbi:hypothetical protein B0F90DRAFT_1728899 [Multifurca ochricompacta]|uniref:Secreted protein n=1 Tax=Multifurca ochricompacta TaxID=376703 RepID=A0AAD4QLG0_9AGAM|nr:hypothetical protein B0F90DRAFT_1728899 [Multifurca ochricompacta]